MEAARVCLDTDVLIDNLRKRSDAVKHVRDLEEQVILATTTVNAFELYYGACKTKNREQNIKSVKQLLKRLVVFDFNEEASEKAGTTLAELESKGQTIDFRDIFISSIALTNDCALSTRNIGHYKRIPDLKLLTAP